MLASVTCALCALGISPLLYHCTIPFGSYFVSLVLLFMIVFDLCQSYTQYSNLVCHVGSQSAALTSTSCGFTTHSPGATLPLHKPLDLYQSVAVAVRLLG